MIPDDAVEAALDAFYSKCDVDFDAAHAIVAALQCAAPHLLRDAWDQGYRECYERQMYEPVPVNPYRKDEARK